MFTIHEGEIIFKENYGSSAKQRLYVKPPDQHNVVVMDEDRLGEFTNLFSRIFLPHGYPESVSNDYIGYQVWDTAQAFCSTITGILATQEVLRSVGVGDTNTTPLAATITWVLKDGCGHIGKIMFAYTHGIYLDAYSKKWRLYADTLNDAAMCIEIALPIFKSYTTTVLCASTMMKAIVGVAGGATRAAMTQHHAVRGNLADVSAKDSAQETAVNLVASVAALMIITLFGNSLVIFGIMMVFHILFNYLAVRTVCLRTLNAPRFLQVIDVYLREEIVATPCVINANEPIIFYHLGHHILDRRLCGFQIKVGHSMKKLIKLNSRADHIKTLQEIYKLKEYVLIPNVQSQKMYVLLRETATTNDILCAYFHAVLFSIVICAINDYPLAIYKNLKTADRPFPQICHTLQRADWVKDSIANPTGRFNYEPSYDLMSYMNLLVKKEWPRLSAGLKQLEWDLTKHLLVVDEWRLCKSALLARAISIDDKALPGSIINAARLITFGEYRDSVVSAEGSEEERAYTIEPEKTESDEKNIFDQETIGSEMQESPSVSPAVADKATHGKVEETPQKKD